MSTPVTITSLDFIDIKDDIKTYLAAQDEFTDFDFEGSGMSVILDILSYATHMMSIQANMSFNEMFLDTATLRNTVISRAKELNYIPSQKSAAIATITLSVTDNAVPVSVVIPKGYTLTSLKDDVTYFFSTTEEETLLPIGGNVYSSQITISQGIYQSTSWLADNSNLSQTFEIQDTGLDTAFLEVSVKQLGGNFELWRNELEVAEILPDDKVWFYNETFNKKLEIYFGDGIIGLTPLTGEEIKAEYLLTDGLAGNGISNFQLTSNISGHTPEEFTVVVDQKSQQGQDEESIDRIKLVAPKSYEAQNRAVTINDYRALILKEYPSIQTMNVWGGEDNIPAQYGKVFIAIKPQYGTQLTPQSVLDIEEYLQKFNVVGIEAVIVDPEYIYTNVTSLIKYKGLETPLTSGGIISLVQSDLEDYITSQSANFGDSIYYSQLTNHIDNIDNAIESNLTTLSLSAKVTPVPFVSQGFVFEYSNELLPGTLSASYIGTVGDTYTMADDSNGLIALYKNGVLNISNQGTIDYSSGKVTIAAFSPDILENTIVDIECQPVDFDLTPSRKTLIIAGNLTNITAIDISN
ncbi:MAG: hypothetical protein KAS32_28285 [Candidatus Peribacteraceae bacterium]|nr:hypothetical protein [Candidatus Peribacteraceae bacterium]